MRSHPFLFLSLVVVLLTSCHTRQQNCVILHAEQEFTVRAHNYPTDSPPHSFCDNNGHLIIEHVRSSDKKLIVYDRTADCIIDSVDLNIKRFMKVCDAIAISKDSFLVALDPLYSNDFYDATMLVIDRNKNILDTVRLDKLPIRTRGNLMTDSPERHILSYFLFPLVYKNGKIFTPMHKWEHSASPSRCPMGYISYPDKNTPNFTALPVTSPSMRKGRFWPYHYKEPLGCSSDDALYFMFGAEPVVYKYDYATGNLSKKKFSLSSIDKRIKPYPVGLYPKQYDPYKARYEDIKYNKTLEHVLLIAKPSCDTTDGPLATDQENFVFTFMLADKDLNPIGEGIIPADCYPNFIPYKKGFLFCKKNAEPVTFIYFTYTIEKRDRNFIKEQVRRQRDSLNRLSPKLSHKDAVAAYLQKITGENFSRHSNFLIFSEYACPSCGPLYADWLEKNRQKLIDEKTAVIVINSKPKEVSDFCQSFSGQQASAGEALPGDILPVYSDTDRTFRFFVEYWINVWQIQYDKERNIAIDKYLNPRDFQ